MIFAPAIILLILFARNRSQAAMAILCMGYFTFITQLVDSSLIGEYTQVYAMIANIAMVVMVSILPLILLSVAPAKAVSRHLIFLALGLLLLIGLNELSKFGFDVAAPKLSG